MNNYKLLFCFLLLSTCLFSQSHLKNDQAINFAANDQKYISFINEVYGSDYPPEEIRMCLVSLIKERITYVTIDPLSGKQYPLISDLALCNKDNPEIHPLVPEVFDPGTFNPLTYNFNFFDAVNYQSYRIDGTNYVMIIAPYTIKS